MPEVGPRSGRSWCRLPRRVPRVPAGAEVHLDVQWAARRATPWAPAGHVVGIDQLVLDAPVSSRTVPRRDAPQHASPAAVDLAGARVGADGVPGAHRQRRAQAGLDARLRRQPGPLDHPAGPGPVRAGSRARHDDGGSDGGTVLDHDAAPLRGPGVEVPIDVRRRLEVRDGRLDPRAGHPAGARRAGGPASGRAPSGSCPAELSRVEWFGDGPHECYPDRRAAATVGRHQSSVDDMYEDYVVPQEHGHRTGVRWLALTGAGRPTRRRVCWSSPTR